MKRLLIFGLLLLFFAAIGCIGQNNADSDVAAVGDVVKVDYIGRFENGSIFDTSMEDVAKQAGIYDPRREYQPLVFTIGAGEMIKGFDRGVLGMKVGETKNITVLPEEGYGLLDERKIQKIPIEEEIPLEYTFPRTFTVPISQFNLNFGSGHKVGDIVEVPGTPLNASVVELTDEHASLSWQLKKGDTFSTSNVPWSEKVIASDDENITIKHQVALGETIEFESVPWNATVTNITGKNFTLHHNRIPDTSINTLFGVTRVRFTEDNIIMDSNHPLAGKTLIFTVTLRAILQSEDMEKMKEHSTQMPPMDGILPEHGRE
jgi:FKBP-type peptidyl-prolyl cis-trans isomerase 2